MLSEALFALVFISRVILGVVFLRSALGKFADSAGFARGLSAYQLLPVWAITPFAWLLPLLELAVGIAFLSGLLLPAAGGIATLLLVAFIAAIATNMRRGRVIACNCHGSSQQTLISWGLVAQNTMLLVLALVLVFAAPLHTTPTAIGMHWRTEFALLSSEAAVPIVLLVCFFVACSKLLSSVVDVQQIVRRAR